MATQNPLGKTIRRDSKRLRPLIGYFYEAWKLAKIKQKDINNQYKDEKPYVNYKSNIKDCLEKISDGFLNLQDIEDMEDIGSPFNLKWTENEIEVFLTNHPELRNVICEDKLLKELEKNKEIADKIQKRFVNPLVTLADICHAASYKFSFPPADWILVTLSAGLSYVGNKVEERALKHNPSLQSPHSLKSVSTMTGSLGTVALLGIGVAFITGPIAAFASPFLIAFGSLAMAVSNVLSLGASLSDFANEIRNKKEPKETYRLRVFKKGVECLKYVLASAFYVCVVVLTVAAVVAIFSNPIGLGALVGVMLTFAIAVASMAMSTMILGLIANYRIKKAQELSLLNEAKNKFKPSSQLKDKLKNIIKNENVIPYSREILTASKIANKVGKGFGLMQKRAARKGGIKALSLAITKQVFKKISDDSIDFLSAKTKTDEMYQKVQYKKILKKETGQEMFVVSVPRDIHQSSLKDNPDKIKRFQNNNHEAEISLAADAGDKTIFIALELNRKFSPLTMDRSNNLEAALKVFEAAKLSKVEIILDPSDRDLLANSPDLQLRDYFKTIENWTSEEFNTYVQSEQKKSNGVRKLGQVPIIAPNKPMLSHSENHSIGS